MYTISNICYQENQYKILMGKRKGKNLKGFNRKITQQAKTDPLKTNTRGTRNVRKHWIN